MLTNADIDYQFSYQTSSDAIFFRSVDLFTPKKFNPAKIVSSMVLQSIQQNNVELDEVCVISNLGFEDLEQASRLLDNYGMKISFHTYSRDQWQLLMSHKDDKWRLLCFLSHDQPVRNDDLRELNAIIKNFTPRTVFQFWQRLVHELPKTFAAQELVYEEALGKYRLLNCERQTIKAFKQQVQHDQKQSPERLLRELNGKVVQPGWGGACLAFKATEKNTHIGAQFATKKFHLPSSCRELKVIDHVLETLAQWTRTLLQTKLQDIGDIVVMTPVYPVAGKILEALEEKYPNAKRNYQFNDFIFGWSPNLSLLQSLTARKKNSLTLLLRLEAFPEFEAFMIWG